MLAEVGLPGAIRSQQAAYGIHPALLDACFQSVAVHPDVQDAGRGGLLLPLGVRRLRCYGPTRNAHYCYARVTRADAGAVEADLDILDEHGTVLLSVCGLQLGTGVSESSNRDRVLNERLLTIDWQQRACPRRLTPAAGAWLLISTSDDCRRRGDLVDRCVEAPRRASARRWSWPQHADHQANAELARRLALLRELQRRGRPDADQRTAIRTRSVRLRGGEYVRHLVRIARELPEIPGEPPRLYVVTRNAQSVLPDDLPNLEQAGLRGLMRVIGTEHPHLRATQIDMDEETDAEQLALQLLGGSEEDETAWRNGDWYTARLRPTPLRPDERRTTVVNHEHDGMRLQIRTPGDLRIDGTRRVRPGSARAGSRSRSRSPHPASTSPMSSSRSADTPASRGGCRSWVPTSPAS